VPQSRNYFTSLTYLKLISNGWSLVVALFPRYREGGTSGLGMGPPRSTNYN